MCNILKHCFLSQCGSVLNFVIINYANSSSHLTSCQVIHVTGRIRCRPALVPGSSRSLHRPLGLVALAHTLPPSTLNEVRMESHMFVFRVNMDLQITYCENRYSIVSPNHTVNTDPSLLEMAVKLYIRFLHQLLQI